jgi:hypothetical protein
MTDSLAFDLARLRSLIPKDFTGRPANSRLRDLDRILASQKLCPSDLRFFESEIQLAAAKHEEVRRQRFDYFTNRFYESTAQNPQGSQIRTGA